MKITITVFWNGSYGNNGKKEITCCYTLFGHDFDYRTANVNFISVLIYTLKKQKNRVVITKSKTKNTVHSIYVSIWEIQFLM